HRAERARDAPRDGRRPRRDGRADARSGWLRHGPHPSLAAALPRPADRLRLRPPRPQPPRVRAAGRRDGLHREADRGTGPHREGLAHPGAPGVPESAAGVRRTGGSVRALAFVVAFASLAIARTVSAGSHPAPYVSTVPGDVNADGIVDIRDVTT